MAAKAGKHRGLGGIEIETCDLEAGGPQAMRKRLAQEADADQADRKTFRHFGRTSRCHPLLRVPAASGVMPAQADIP